MFYYKNYENVNIIEESMDKKGAIHLANFEGVKDKDYLIKHNITHVLSVIPKTLSNFNSINSLKITQLVIDAKDMPSFNILPELHRSADFIENGIKTGNVLVHCAAGISRSTTCLIAYYIKYKNMKWNDALDYIKIKRSCACPNTGFRKQLVLFQENKK